MCIFSGEGDHVLAKAEFDFDGEGEEELSFRAGAVLRLAPKGQQPRVRGWLLGSLDGSTEGIVPANYVKVSAAKLYSVQLLDSFVGADKKCQWGSFNVIPVLGIDLCWGLIMRIWLTTELGKRVLKRVYIIDNVYRCFGNW